MHSYQHLQALQEKLSELWTVLRHKSQLPSRRNYIVMFIDTTVLINGDMKYPFDVNKAIM